MAQILNIGNLKMGTSLQALLMADEIVPGAAPSYQLCKIIYSVHPLGKKMADKPVHIAQSQPRELAMTAGPEDEVIGAFKDEWKRLGADTHIANVESLSRMYGISSIALLEEGVDTNEPLDWSRLADAKISFNVFDPLNTAGSLVLNQEPNALDFMKTSGTIQVQGTTYHRSRTCVRLHEEPLYIDYVASGYGFVGRSVYQRALYPLKSFVNSMVTDDMVVRKAGLLIAKMEQPGSVVDNIMLRLAGVKRSMLKQGETENVLSIAPTEDIESLNMLNLEGPFTAARKNIIENIATAADMPSILLNNETFAEGFGEGSEDAKAVATYIDGLRREMQPLYDFFDRICMYRAWNKEFYATIQARYPEQYKDVPHETAMTEWMASFEALWPNLITEPDSKKVETDKVKVEALVSSVQVVLPLVRTSPDNVAKLVEWYQSNINENKSMFPHPLDLDIEEIRWTDPADFADGDADGEEDDMPKPAKPAGIRADSLRAVK